MVYFVYSSEYEMEPGREFLESLATAESGMKGLEAAADDGFGEEAKRGRGRRREGNMVRRPAPDRPRPKPAASTQGMSRPRTSSPSRGSRQRQNHGRRPRQRSAHAARSPSPPPPLSPTYIPAATSYQELSISERRLGNEAIKSILDRGKTHNGLIARAQASVDTSEPRTRSINRWHNALRLRDPMPELDLPKDVKLHSSWTQLAEMKWRKDWHERLLQGTKSNIDVRLPKHVKVYQRRKKEELRKLIQGDRHIA